MLPKKYHIKTWGCQMNVYDSQRIGEVLQSLGYESTEDLSDSDIIILNTCHIREKATEKVYSDIGRLNKLKIRRKAIGKNLIIAVSGCVAHLVFGPQTWHRLKDMIKSLEENHKKVCDTDFPVEEKFDNLPELFDKNRIVRGSSFVAIQEGCDKFCTYCVVPYTRGAEYSRPVFQILSEVKQLVQNGAMEITLLGQNVNAYHGVNGQEEWTLGRLIRELATIENLKRIRYTTSYPAEVDEDLINAHRDVDKLMPFLHLPVQAGSNKILKAMNRRHSREDYLKLVDKLKQANPSLALSSDFIVGFPGETEEDFNDTLNLIKEVGFIQSYSFMYSKRPGTPAATMENQVLDEVKAERLQILQALLNQIQQEFNNKSIGQTYDVLLDRTGKKSNQLVGKSPYMQAVLCNDIGQEYLGKMVKLKIQESYQNSLNGLLVVE